MHFFVAEAETLGFYLDFVMKHSVPFFKNILQNNESSESFFYVKIKISDEAFRIEKSVQIV